MLGRRGGARLNNGVFMCKKATLPRSEKRLLKLYRTLTPEAKRDIQRFMDALGKATGMP